MMSKPSTGVAFSTPLPQFQYPLTDSSSSGGVTQEYMMEVFREEDCRYYEREEREERYRRHVESQRHPMSRFDWIHRLPR